MEIFIIIWFVLLGNAADQVYGPGVVGPVECVGIACDAEHGNGSPAREPAAPDEPDDDGDHDKGHGNDDDRDDEDNPGKGKHKGRK